jgi:hypothetical protein
LLARFDARVGAWRMAGGIYKVALAERADTFELERGATLESRVFWK